MTLAAIRRTAYAAEGRAAADRAALAAGFALVTDGALALPALTPASSGASTSGDDPNV